MKGKHFLSIAVAAALLSASFPAAPVASAQGAGQETPGIEITQALADGKQWTRLPAGPALSDGAEGWDLAQQYATIQMADINGDGKDELLGRNSFGLDAWSFDDAGGWIMLPQRLYTMSDANGWGQPQYYETIQAGDIDGDGRDEVLGRTAQGLNAWDYDSGSGWDIFPLGLGMSDAAGWINPQNYTTIQTADIDGDGTAEVLSKATPGIIAFRWNGTAQNWVQLKQGPSLSDGGGYTNPQYYTTIQTGDVNGDGSAELLARGIAGVDAWHYDGETNPWSTLPHTGDWPELSDSLGWASPQYYSTIQTGDINGDGRVELLARGASGIKAWRYDAPSGWKKLRDGPAWIDGNRWDQAACYLSIQTGDINGDGRDELLGRASTEIETWRYVDESVGWTRIVGGPAWGFWEGWEVPQYYATIQTGDFNADGQSELLGRMSTNMEVWGWAEDVPPPQVLELVYVDQFTLQWAGSNNAFYSPVVPDGYFSLGDYSQGDFAPASGFTFAARALVDDALKAPTGYAQVWGGILGSLYRPVPPDGYVCLGLVAQAGSSTPDTERVRCVREGLAVPARLGKATGWDGSFHTWETLPAVDYGIYSQTFTGVNSYVAKPHILWALDSRAISGAEPLNAAQIDTLIQENGPVVYFHPNEEYFLDDPEYILDNAASLGWGLLNNYCADCYDTFNITYEGSMETSSATLMLDVDRVLESIKPYPPYYTSSNFDYWLNINDADINGDPAGTRSKALVRAIPWNTFFTDLQFWFYYPFNGPGRFFIEVYTMGFDHVQMDEPGRHYGDWESVTLRFENSTSKLVAAYMSQHAWGQWLKPVELQYFGAGNKHPVVYSAKYSHANYPSAGNKYYTRVYDDWMGPLYVTVDLYDEAGAGTAFEAYLPGNYEVLDYFSFPVPDWLLYKAGKWGQYVKNEFTYKALGLIDAYTFEEVSGAPAGPAKRDWFYVGDFSQIQLNASPELYYDWPKASIQNFLWQFTFLPAINKSP